MTSFNNTNQIHQKDLETASKKVTGNGLSVILLMAEIVHQLIGILSHYLRGFIHPTRWAPTIYKWSYNPYKWPYKWVTGVITLLIGVITPFVTGKGAHLAGGAGFFPSTVTPWKLDEWIPKIHGFQKVPSLNLT